MTQNLTELLKFYRGNGLCTIPIPYQTKVATIAWGEFQKRLPTDTEIRKWFSNDNSNIALVCGAISGGLVVLDCDTEEVFYSVGMTIKERMGVADILDFTLVSQTGRGFQYLLKVKEPVKNQKFPKLDIKAEGGYIVAPPSIHPNGKQYHFLNPLIPIRTINNLVEIGIDTKPKPKVVTAGEQPTWVTDALQRGVTEGQRNDMCFKLAAYFARHLPQDVALLILRQWNDKNKPPLPEGEILSTMNSAYKESQDNDSIVDNTISFNNADGGENSYLKRDNFGTTSGQKEWGTYARQFDEFMREVKGKVDKRECAEAIGLKVTSDAFRKILSRRKGGNRPQVRAYRGSPNLIEWINRDYRITPEDIGIESMLKIKLPLDIPESIKIPSRSVTGIAGYKSSGKTAFLLETGELNVYSQDKPIYYWYNEMGELLLNTRLEDYPLLVKARREGRFRPVMQGDFEFADVIDPEAINLIDYIDRNDDIWLIGEDIRSIFTPLNTGCSIFALQKKHGDNQLGYGGTPTLKLATLYITLDEQSHDSNTTHGIARIIVCKNWEEINPVGMFCNYHTGGEHGKLFIDDGWQRSIR